MNDNKVSATEIPEPGLSRLIFADTRLAWVWLVIRLYVGWIWLSAGIEKIQSPAWLGVKSGVALRGFILGALNKASGLHPDVQSWYAAFLKDFVLPNSMVFSHIVSYGEILIGVALIIGAFTGIAAFFGGFMNMNFLLSGTVSINPVLFVFELFLILAWRTAGWWGVDRFLLPILGTPWRPGEIFKQRQK